MWGKRQKRSGHRLWAVACLLNHILIECRCQVFVFGLTSKRESRWVRIDQLRKPVKSNTIPKTGQAAELAEVESGHRIWYCGRIDQEFNFILDPTHQGDGRNRSDLICSRIAMRIKQPIDPELLRCSTETAELTYDEAMNLVSCSATPSKLFSIFPSRAEDELVPDDLAELTYPDDLDQAQNLDWKHFGFDLEAFADMVSLKEANELSAVAERFHLHYSSICPPPAPPWAESQPAHHRHLAHVRTACAACPYPHAACRRAPRPQEHAPLPARPARRRSCSGAACTEGLHRMRVHGRRSRDGEQADREQAPSAGRRDGDAVYSGP